MSLQQQRKKWAARLKTERAKADMSQEELAHEAGYSVSYIQKIETAAKGTLERFEHLLGIIKQRRKTA